MWSSDDEIGVRERDGPDLALLDEEAELRATPGALWRAEWSTEDSMWYLWNIVTKETWWDEWQYVNRGKDKRSFWWNTRTEVSSWHPPQDPTRRTQCAVCKWQRCVATFLYECRRKSLDYISCILEVEGQRGIDHLKMLEHHRFVELEGMD